MALRTEVNRVDVVPVLMVFPVGEIDLKQLGAQKTNYTVYNDDKWIAKYCTGEYGKEM